MRSLTLLSWALALVTAWGLVAAGTLPARAASDMPLVKVLLAGQELLAEAPRTNPERYRGLSGRPSLAPGRAMIFTFLPAQKAHMHMTGMQFGIDFIWAREGRVLGVTPKVYPTPPRLQSIVAPAPVDVVLEVPAGWAAAHGVKAGMPLELASAQAQGKSSAKRKQNP
ncbi:MAG: DUF192 domain-containing protein [Deltaproteobacteria bacterium]|nr:DUF192 domain-containing protein [Deltaproteobacteria bacterium]